MADAKIRLYVDHPLGPGQSVPLNRDQGNYLFGVMRLSIGAAVLLFNGIDGEFLAEIAKPSKRNGVLICKAQTRALQMPPDLWFLFAPIKKTRTVFIVEKAAEMGAARIMPVLTDFTDNDRVRREKMQAQAVEAAEQCGGTFVPEVVEPQSLAKVLDAWPEDRGLMFCDENISGAGETISGADRGKWGILIGPEGGFSPAERTRLRQMSQTTSISLGPRILRADTAAVAALALWQIALGDW